MVGRSLRVFVHSRPSVEWMREGECISDPRPPAFDYDGYRVKLATGLESSLSRPSSKTINTCYEAASSRISLMYLLHHGPCMNETLYSWTFKFHKVVRQQNSGAVEEFILPYSAVYLQIQNWKIYWNRYTLAKVIVKIKVAAFLWPMVYCYLLCYRGSDISSSMVVFLTFFVVNTVIVHCVSVLLICFNSYDDYLLCLQHNKAIQRPCQPRYIYDWFINPCLYLHTLCLRVPCV